MREVISELTDKPVHESRTISEDTAAFRGLTALIFLSPFPYLNSIAHFSTFPKFVFIQVGTLILLAVWFWQNARHDKIRIVKCSLYWPLIGFLIWGAVSLIWSLSGYYSGKYWIHWFCCALVFFLSIQLVFNFRRIYWVMRVVAWSSFLIALFGIVVYLLEYQVVRHGAVPAATFGNKNMASHLIVLSVPLGVGLFFSSKRSLAVWLYAFGICFLFTFLLYTKTRAAWAAVIAELLFLSLFFVYERFRQVIRFTVDRQKKAALIFSLFLTVFMANLTPDGLTWQGTDYFKRISQEFDTVETLNLDKEHLASTSSLVVRIKLWRNTFALFLENPIFGIGID
ncbi:O-antigen ligase family protein, partial [Thermodesulfobacteriota bacterium]